MEGIIESFGFRIYTKVEGTGQPVLLLHSLWGSHKIFDSLANFLAQKNRVIRIDFPGHGNSPSCDNDFTFEEFAIVLNTILCQLDINEKINLVGHSMGGFAAMAYSHKYTDKVASLTLVHTLIQHADLKSIRHRIRQADLIRQNRKKLLLQFSNESNFAPGNSKKFLSQYHQLEQISSLVTNEGALAAINAINSREDSLPFLMKADFPILVIIGKKDRVYNPEDQLREYKNLAGAEVLILEESGHMGFFEEEQIFNHRIKSFIECSLIT
jgi:pimeloyl-ACP methyl ester carboxylesterase